MLLYEDDRVLLLSKPAGLSMATSSREGRSGEDVVHRLLAAAGLPNDPGSLLLVHRLDVGTSGVVLLAKGNDVHRVVSRAFQERGVTKRYRALAWGHPVPAQGVFREPLGRDPRDGRKMKVSPEGKPAVTAYRTLRRLPSVADLELVPETGRTHQIRVHLAAAGHPIVGDDFYGGGARWRGVRDPARRRLLAEAVRPLLHAAFLAVPALSLAVEAPLPPDFARVLDGLRG